jgi:nucleoside-diphosphate-sugar epimerase
MALPIPEINFGPTMTSEEYRAAVAEAYGALPPFKAEKTVPTFEDAFGGKKVLIVGAGCLATAIAQRIAALNPSELHLLVPAGSKAPEVVLGKVHFFNIHSQILRLESLPKQCHYVFNAHEMVSDWAKEADLIEENTDVARAVFKVATDYRDQGTLQRLVHFSTGEVYGYRARPPTEADMPSDEHITYSSAKIFAEIVLAKSIERHLPATVLRLGALYGTGPDGEVQDASKRMSKGWNVVLGDGSHDPGLIHAEDAAEAALLAAKAPHAIGQLYNICGDSRTSWNDFYNEVAAGAGTKKPWTSLPAFLAFWIAYILEAIYSLFGWYRSQPPITMRRVVRELVDGDFPSYRAKRELGWVPRVEWKAAVREAAEATRREGNGVKKSN